MLVRKPLHLVQVEDDAIGHDIALDAEVVLRTPTASGSLGVEIVILHLEDEIVGEVFPEAANGSREVLSPRELVDAPVLAGEVAHGHSMLLLERSNELALGRRWGA